MHVIDSLYAHPRSTSFVFALWVFRFWFLEGFFEVYHCRRCLLFPHFELSLDSSLLPKLKIAVLVFFPSINPSLNDLSTVTGPNAE